ncbi:MAG: hypothetical protein ACRC5Q_03320 [Culicoidibacterales bacterium]
MNFKIQKYGCHKSEIKKPACQVTEMTDADKKNVLIAVIVIVSVIATGGLALAGYFFFKNLQSNADEIE